jgi:hypothetical protein
MVVPWKFNQRKQKNSGDIKLKKREPLAGLLFEIRRRLSRATQLGRPWNRER